MKKIQQGFTLIELMIVVAIIGILAAVAIPAYQDYIVKTKLSKVLSTIEPVKLALMGYFNERGGFPNPAAGNLDVTLVNTATLLPAAPADSVWARMGMNSFPTLPAEVSQMSYFATPAVAAAPNDVSETFSLILTLAGIKVGSIDGAIVSVSPTTTAPFMPPLPLGQTTTDIAPGQVVLGTATQWYYGCNIGTTTQPLDRILVKVFANPNVVGALNCLGLNQVL